MQESEVVQSYLTLSDPMDCSLPGSSIHGIFQARIQEWVAIAFSASSCYSHKNTKSLCPERDELVFHSLVLQYFHLSKCKRVHTSIYSSAPIEEGFPRTSVVDSPSAMQKMWIQFLGQEDPPEKEMATHSRILAWRIPMDRGALRAIVHGVAKSWTQLSN